MTQMEQEILKNVVALAVTVYSYIITEDMNEHLEQIIREVRKHNSGFS